MIAKTTIPTKTTIIPAKTEQVSHFLTTVLLPYLLRHLAYGIERPSEDRVVTDMSFIVAEDKTPLRPP
jgi:hypothetical protein